MSMRLEKAERAIEQERATVQVLQRALAAARQVCTFSGPQYRLCRNVTDLQTCRLPPYRACWVPINSRKWSSKNGFRECSKSTFHVVISCHKGAEAHVSLAYFQDMSGHSVYVWQRS